MLAEFRLWSTVIFILLLISVALLCGCEEHSLPAEEPPPLPGLVSPLNGSTVQTLSPVLHWNSSPVLATYRLQVSPDTAFSPVLLDDSVSAATSRQVGPLVNGTTYFWRVNASNGASTSSWSHRWTFSTASAPPPPVLTSPANGSTEPAVSPVLNWSSSPGAATYRLQISLNSGFSLVRLDDSGSVATFRQVGPLLNGTTYFWRVNASGSTGTSAWSPVWSFSTANPAPPPILPPSLNVLYIGNSLTYTNNLPATVAGIAALDSGNVNYYTVARPGFALVDHLDGGSDAVDQIGSGGWDFVVMQQGPSSLPESRDLLIEGVRRFDVYIRAVQAVPALYMVWPDKSRYAYFEDVRVSYKLAADTVGGVFLPTGESWLNAWAVDSSLALYGPDNFHPSPLGTYLAALVIYERLSGRDVRNLPPQAVVDGLPLNVGEETVRHLQQAAHATTDRYK